MSGLKIRNDRVYGNYRGLVEDNNDPLQYGRVRVRVYPLYRGIEAVSLPWAVPAMGLFDGAGNGIGSFAIPRVGSYVFVFFEAGDVYQPVYFAEAQTATYGLPAARTTSYPNKKVWHTSGGVEISIDDTTKIVRVDHPTGAFIKIDTDGSVTIDTVKKVIINSDDNTELTVGGDLTANVTGKAQVTASGNVIIEGAQVSVNP